jgi:hypothetical protein
MSVNKVDALLELGASHPLAVVNVLLTVGALESAHTGAGVLLSCRPLLLLLLAQRSVKTRCRRTRVVRQAARRAHESRGAFA